VGTDIDGDDLLFAYDEMDSHPIGYVDGNAVYAG
jgi:hypothetical protein